MSFKFLSHDNILGNTQTLAGSSIVVESVVIMMIWIGMIQINVIIVCVDVILIDVIQNYNLFAPNYFNLRIHLRLILVPSVLKLLSPSRFSLSLYRCSMPWHAPVRKTQHTSTEVVVYPNVSWWYVIINILPKCDFLHFSATLQTGN